MLYVSSEFAHVHILSLVNVIGLYIVTVCIRTSSLQNN
jgi:hypothetical protein